MKVKKLNVVKEIDEKDLQAWKDKGYSAVLSVPVAAESKKRPKKQEANQGKAGE